MAIWLGGYHCVFPARRSQVWFPGQGVPTIIGLCHCICLLGSSPTIWRHAVRLTRATKIVNIQKDTDSLCSDLFWPCMVNCSLGQQLFANPESTGCHEKVRSNFHSSEKLKRGNMFPKNNINNQFNLHFQFKIIELTR